MPRKTAANKQKVTLSIDKGVYKTYQKYCEENAIRISKQIELFMKKEFEEHEKAKKQ